MKTTILKLPSWNRMIRMGFGKRDNQWYIRMDLWYYGIRITK